MSQRQPLVISNKSQAFPDDKSATSSVEAVMYEQMCDLADLLRDLLKNISLAGFDKDLRQSLQECFQLYFKLATRLWEEVAANRLDELARDSAYYTDIEELKQQIACLLNRCKTRQEPHASVKRKWKRRKELYQRALDEWLSCLGKNSDTMLSDPTKSSRIPLQQSQQYHPFTIVITCN